MCCQNENKWKIFCATSLLLQRAYLLIVSKISEHFHSPPPFPLFPKNWDLEKIRRNIKYLFTSQLYIILWTVRLATGLHFFSRHRQSFWQRKKHRSWEIYFITSIVLFYRSTKLLNNSRTQIANLLVIIIIKVKQNGDDVKCTILLTPYFFLNAKLREAGGEKIQRLPLSGKTGETGVQLEILHTKILGVRLGVKLLQWNCFQSKYFFSYFREPIKKKKFSKLSSTSNKRLHRALSNLPLISVSLVQFSNLYTWSLSIC